MSNPISTTVGVQATVAVTDNGSIITPAAVAWSTSDAAVATVDPVSGVVTPVSPGMATIQAECTVHVASQTKPMYVAATGVVNVTAVGDNLVAVVDFKPLA